MVVVHFSVINVFTQNTKNFGEPFTLDGTLKGRDTGIIVLWYPDTNYKYIKDTVSVKEGKFQFQGFINEPSYVHLIGSKAKGNYASFYLEPVKQTILLEENTFGNFVLSGSFTQKQEDTLKKVIGAVYANYKGWLEESDSILKLYSKEKDSSTRAKLNEELNHLRKRNAIVYDSARKVTLLFIANHPNSYISPSYLSTFLVNRTISNDSVEILFNQFTDRIKNSMAGRDIKEELIKRRANIEAPAFTINDINGKNFSLSDLKGKYVLLDFWASWCIPCVKQIPELKSVFKKYNPKGFEIIAISIDEDKEKWIDAVKKHQLQNFWNVLANNEVHEKYSNTRQPIPSQLLINRQGIIIWNSMNQSAESLEKVLSKEFNTTNQ